MLSEKYWLAVGGSETYCCGPGRVLCVGIITRMNQGISEGLCDGQEAVMEVEGGWRNHHDSFQLVCLCPVQDFCAHIDRKKIDPYRGP